MMTYMMQSKSLTKLDEVHPLLAEAIKKLAFEFWNSYFNGNELIVTEGLRTWDRQQELWNQGRTTPGDRVTNAKPGYSWHQFGLAVDVAPVMSGVIDWRQEHPVWQRLIALADQHTELVHVNLNRTQRDWPHFQLSGIPLSPTDLTRDFYTTRITNGMTVKDVLQEMWNSYRL